MEGVLVLLGLALGAAVMITPIVVIVLWTRVSRLDREVSELRVRVSAAGRSSGWSTAPATSGADKASVERVAGEAYGTPEPRAGAEVPSSPADDIWITEPSSTKPAPATSRASERAARLAGLAGTAATAAAGTRASASGESTAGAPSRSVPVGSQSARVPGDDDSDSRDRSTSSGLSLEEILAGQWLTWVGAFAVIVGVGFFFKYAIDNDMIGPTGRVALGLLAGVATFVGGAFAMLKNYRWLAQGLVGAALGILYFALHAASQWYHLVSIDVSFVGMVLVTAAALAFSAYFATQATAILGLIGGFLTPIMLSTGQDAQWTLFSYILLLDAGVLGVATFRKWQPLQCLAFVLTIVMWLGWFGEHYAPEKLSATLILMTATFLLFALLAVWHNVWKKTAAVPGDFFLILATPVAYFIGLYAVTYDDYSALHGLMAIGLAAVYLVLGLLALAWNPAGKNIVVALCGVAASFLTIAIPLQLTGHWIAIAWAMEALLLVEMGLHFQERKLRAAGFALLAFVQLILAYYSLGTVTDPAHFHTRFTREPIAVDVVPGAFPSTMVEATGRPVPKPSWTDVFNGRSFSFLANILVMIVLAWEYRRRGLLTRRDDTASIAGEDVDDTQAARSDVVSPQTASAWLLGAVPVVALLMLLVESFALGHGFGWYAPTYLGVFAFWTAAIGALVVGAAVTTGPAWYRNVAYGVFGLAGLFLVVSALITLGNWRYQYQHAVSTNTLSPAWRLFLVNPRGLGFLSTIVAACLSAWALRPVGEGDEDDDETATRPQPGGMSPSALFGVFAHLSGLVMLTVEFYAQGVVRDWGTATALGITFVWTAYAVATLVAGIVYRSAVVRSLALGLFLLTTAKVFLYDVWHLSTGIRYMAFFGLGISLLLVSFLYRRYRDRIRAWMTPVAVAAALLLPMSSADAQDARADLDRQTLHSLEMRWPLDLSKVDAGAGGKGQTLRALALPAGLYGTARADLGDLRVFAASDDRKRVREIPYVLHRPADVQQVTPRHAPLINLSQKGTTTEFLLDLSESTEPVNDLTIEVRDDEHNFERGVKLYGADRRDAEEWNLITDDGYLLDVTRPGHRTRVARIEFPPSRFAWFKVVVENSGKKPLPIVGAKLFDRRKERAERREYPATIVSTTTDPKLKDTVIVFDLQYERLPCVGVKLDVVNDGNYYRSVRVDSASTLKEPVAWQPVATGELYRVDRPDLQAMRSRVEFSETTGRFLRLSIHDGDDEPLRVAGATALGIDRWLLVEQRALEGGNDVVAVFAGSPKLRAPSYDLARTIPSDVAPSTVPQVELKPAEPNPHYQGSAAPGVPWSEQNQPLLWTATIAGVVLLGGLTAWILRLAAKQPPAPTDG